MEIPTIYVLYLAGAGFGLVGLGYLRKIIKGDYRDSDIDEAMTHLEDFDSTDETATTIADLIHKLLEKKREED